MQPAPIERLAAAFARLPGVGPRTAQRLTYYVLSRPDDEARALAAALVEVKEKIGECRICFNLAEGDRCVICQDARRDPTLLCVVEGPADILPIERTHEYRGRYHVLGGSLSPVDGVGPRDLHLAELYRRVTQGDPDLGEPGAPPTGPLVPTSDFGGDDAWPTAQADGPASAGGDDSDFGPTGDGQRHRSPVQEVVVATNPTTSGEATALHIGAELREVAPHVTVSRLASGLPVGADLEHADEVTLGRAFAGRRTI
ncbi:recombination mediator RecR [Patulibacter americanus]|uniref:recombination mediator RecR n=1 Tax=Patulibacter americanus TaxID=588672 RepID=UPI0003B42B94|nr:recombination mediator RecR [Patulibacter americanus]